MAEPILKEDDIKERSDQASVVSSEVENDNLSVEMGVLKEIAAAVWSEPHFMFKSKH